MVETEPDAQTGALRIVLRPNASLNKGQALILLGGMALVMGTIAGVITAFGGWLVLPFSGLEWLLLVYCSHLSFKSSAMCEVITISDTLVKLERGRHGPEQTFLFQRAWVILLWMQSPVRGRPSRLAFRWQGREVEVGRFLVESERQVLARELKALLGSR